jgi:hypothetical protein
LKNEKPISITNRVGFVLLVEVFYLLVLFVMAVIYLTDLHKLLPPLPASLGSLPLAVPWFGALGAIMISLSGIVDHRDDWDPSLKYWHYVRPLIGGTFASISILIFQAGILAVAASPTPQTATTASNLLYYVVAFLVGYREAVFRELTKRLADVIITPGGPPTVQVVNPPKGTEDDGTTIAVGGGAPPPTVQVVTPLKGAKDDGTTIAVDRGVPPPTVQVIAPSKGPEGEGVTIDLDRGTPLSTVQIVNPPPKETKATT